MPWPACPSKSFGAFWTPLDVCNESDDLFDCLKDALLGQFGKSKWQSYLELLRLPMGKLKPHLPPGVSPDTNLFLAMFLICLPPSMCEAVGAGNHKTAAAMVKAADTQWDARGGHDPTVAAAMIQRSRSPSPNSGKGGDKRSGNACSKRYPLPA